MRVILIDDDRINNLYGKYIVTEAAGEIDIRIFDVPEDGFEYISREYVGTICPTILFLDINMPSWSGWEFLENFEMLDKNIQKQFKIYMLSSSLDPSDRKRATDNSNVIDYIEKPLLASNVLSALQAQLF